MEVQEYETLVGELETRVDRLRSLYDQYFMGIEKTVPNVSHKDVERRIILLRREQVRNTALRFRFQMIVQRFNTYQTHWQRICRQIEEGTYKRHVLKAKAKLAERERKASGEFSIDVTFDEDFDLDAMNEEEPVEPPPRQTPLPAPLAASSPFDDDDLGDRTLAGIPAPAGGAAPAPPGMQTAPHRLGAIALARVAVPRPAAGQPPAPPATQQPAQPAPQAAAPAPTRWRKAEPKVEPPRQPAPAPAPPAQAAPQAPVAKPAAPPPTPAKPPPPAPAKPPPPAPAKPAAAPAQAKPATPPKPAKPGDLSDERMRQLYSSYVEAKRARKESTAGITYESLSKTLRDSSDKLREKHGRSVDFEVTVKDGKTILKPIIR